MVKLTNLDDLIKNNDSHMDEGVYTYEIIDSINLFFENIETRYSNVFDLYNGNKEYISFSFIKDGKLGEVRASPLSYVVINPRRVTYFGPSKPHIDLWNIEDPGFIVWGRQPVDFNNPNSIKTFQPLDPVAVRQFLNLEGKAVPLSPLKDTTAPSKPRIYDTPRADVPNEHAYDDTKKEAFIEKGKFSKTETSYYLPVGTHYKHLKRGSVVKIAAIASLQIEDEKLDMTPMVVYTHDDHTWVRPVDEFLDGRFIPLDEDVALKLIEAQKEKAKIEAVAKEHGLSLHEDDPTAN